jgi:hypothetical protein
MEQGKTEQAAVSMTPAMIAAIVKEQLDAALKDFARRQAPIGGVSAAGAGRPVRVKHEAEPPHGEPADRVGTVDSEHSRALKDGKEVLILNVRFKHPDTGLDVIEHHAADALVGA